jgi:asparagine synthase (glutamine-hydrolysing)
MACDVLQRQVLIRGAFPSPFPSMCGIAGIIHVHGAPIPEGVLRAMTDAVQHRGPDGAGTWSEDGVGFGHRRLAIVDLSPAGHQPMRTSDGQLVLTFNGEIYNWRELRRELERKGARFRSQTDTEVILEAYRAWGARCVERFNGMFAFALYDRRTRRLLLARDRYGQKPLYYRWDGRTLLFGSEIKSLLRHPAVRVAVDTAALGEYFTFQNVFSDATLFAGIRLLPRARTLTLTLGDPASFSERQWWDYQFTDERGVSEAEYVEELDRLFRQAITRQVQADVEVGTYLSGGIDSGAVTCLTAAQFRDVKSFTAGFDLSSASGLEMGFDERSRAEQLSAAYRTEHYQVVLKAGDMERVMPDLVWHLEDLRVGQCYPNYYVARLASRFVKVVLAGTGGDEIFAGYPWRYYRAVRNATPMEYVDKYLDYWQRLVPGHVRGSFFRPGIQAEVNAAPPEQAFRNVLRRRSFLAMSPDDYVNHSLYFELNTFLHGLLVVEDKLSMAHGLETRVPFLDNDLVDFALRVPVRHKLRHVDAVSRIDENGVGPKTERYFNETGDGKLILRKALSRYVPAGYANAKKQGFSAPDASWFRGPSIGYIRRLLTGREAVLYDYIEPGAVRTILDEHEGGRSNHRLAIWSLLCFETWLRRFRDGQVNVAAAAA